MFIIQCGSQRVQVTAESFYPIRNGHVVCPVCAKRAGHVKGSGKVLGKLSGTTCSAKCRNARRFDCECECVGANHGVDTLTVL